MEKQTLSDWDQKWHEVGAIWKNEKSMSLKLTEDMKKGEMLLITTNKNEKENAPAFRVWKKRN